MTKPLRCLVIDPQCKEAYGRAERAEAEIERLRARIAELEDAARASAGSATAELADDFLTRMSN